MDDNSILTDIKLALRKYIKKTEDYFENHTAFHIGLKTLIFTLSAFIGLAEILDLFEGNWPTNLTILILFLIGLFFAVADFGHVYLAKNRKHQMELRDIEIEARNRIISQISDHLLQYDIIQWKMSRVFEENGRTLIERHMTIRATGPILPLIYVKMWLVDSTISVNANDINFTAYYNGGPIFHKLKDILIEDNASHKTFAVILSPPLQKDEITSIFMTYEWPKAWKKLFELGEDRGSFEILNNIYDCELYFELPEGWVFTHHDIAPQPPDWINDLESPKNSFTIHMANLKAGNRLSYTLYATKKQR